jgi:hypothetical protein
MTTQAKWIEHVKAHGGEEGDAYEFESKLLHDTPQSELPTCAIKVTRGEDAAPAYWTWLITQYKGE